MKTRNSNLCKKAYGAAIVLWRTTGAIVLLAATAVFGGEAGSNEPWEVLRPGMAKAVFYGGEGQDRFRVEVIRIEPKKYKFKTYGTLRYLNPKAQYPTFSLEEMVQQTKPEAMINGGFSLSFSLPTADGLLIQDGTKISPLNSRSTTLSGVFCVTGLTVKIVRSKDIAGEKCDNALQAGPILVNAEGGKKINIDPAEPSRNRPKYERSAVAVDTAGRVLFVRSEKTHLYPLADLLTKSENGLGVVSALNLSGDVESGMYYVGHEGNPHLVGIGEAPIASTIGVFSLR